MDGSVIRAGDSGGDGGDGLRGVEVAVCGRLLAMERAEAARRIARAGGRFAAVPRATTDVAVLGEQCPGGARRVARLRAAGVPIETIDEREFLRRLGVAIDLGALFGIERLAALSGVGVEVARGWVRRGWLRPARAIGRLQLFDFGQLASARALAALCRGGVQPARLRRAVAQLGRWHPDAASLRGALAAIAADGELLVRTPEGRLAEPTGQLRLEFGRSEPAGSAIARRGGLGELGDRRAWSDPWERRPRLRLARPAREPLAAFEAGLEHERAGRLAEALADYQEALAGFGPEPEVLFNLGNVLFALGRAAEAAAHFLDAVELDPGFAEAWNNLGNALTELGRAEHGVLAYRQALLLRPDYADAHFNLAEALHLAGRAEAARPHFQAYLRRDPFSRWARRARARLDGA